MAADYGDSKQQNRERVQQAHGEVLRSNGTVNHAPDRTEVKEGIHHPTRGRQAVFGNPLLIATFATADTSLSLTV